MPADPLPIFTPGERLLARDLNRLTGEVRRHRILSFAGGRVTVTPGGTSLAVDPRGVGGGGGQSLGRWAVITRTIEDVLKVGVIPTGDLLEGPRYTDRLEVEGRLESDSPADDDAGWSPVVDLSIDFERVWIQIEYATSTPETIIEARIANDGGGDDWDGGEFEYEDLGGGDYRLKFHRYLLAFIELVEDVPTIEQRTDDHLILVYGDGPAYDAGGDNPITMGCRGAVPHG